MNAEYRATELANAEAEQAAARKRMNEARTRKAWRQAEEDLNFWQSKVAFLKQAR